MNAPYDAQRIANTADAAARHAIALQEHPGFQQACARLATYYLGLIRTSELDDRDGRETAFLMLRALDALQQDIASAAAGGAITARNLRSQLK